MVYFNQFPAQLLLLVRIHNYNGVVSVATVVGQFQYLLVKGGR